MDLLTTLAAIDGEFVPGDPGDEIWATGTTMDGRSVHCVLSAFDGELLIWPGIHFLPYGGVWYNPLLQSITAD
jgi:hypothetical protein